MMKAISFIEDEKGWTIETVFTEKGPDKQNIGMPVFWPKIDDLRQMQPFNNNHLNTTHNLGEIEILSYMSLPVEIQPRIENSLRWSSFTGNSDGTNDKRRMQDEPIFSKMKRIVKYPKTYIKTRSGWIPYILQEYNQMVERITKGIEQKQKEISENLAAEKKFNEEFRQGLKDGSYLTVLHKWTVNIRQQEIEEEILEEIKMDEREYYPVEIQVFGGETKTKTGIFNYDLLKR